MRLCVLAISLISIYTMAWTQEKLDGVVLIDMANSVDNNSPGITVKANDDFYYDGRYINHYGIGFHDYKDNYSSLNGRNFYASGYFGIDLFTGGKNRLRVNSNGFIGVGKIHPTSTLDVNGTSRSIRLLLDKPNSTSDWNQIWQTGFYDAYNIINAPESNQWFWGINIGHRSNRLDYQYGGQILIRNTWDRPTMYFRSRKSNGEGIWAKIIHNQGSQRIEGNLTINGQIFSEEIEVKEIAANNITINANGNTADFVFADDYQLRELSEVESFITTNRHLPDVPSAATMEEEGVNLAEMNKLLLQKVEELTLYVIEMQKESMRQKEEINNLKNK